MTESKYFHDNSEKFASILDAAVSVSAQTAGRMAERRVGWCTRIFARACATGHSIRRLLIPVRGDYGTTIDHASIGSLARGIVEADILISYLSENGVSDIEWECRTLIFHIHDCAARVRLFKGLKQEDEHRKNSETLAELRQRIGENARFKQLPSDAQQKALAGSLIYINGLRSAAEVAGWNKGVFDGLYNYLSMQSHSAPMSFYRMDDRGIDHKNIAPFQYYFAGLALELSSNSLRLATERVRRLFPDISDSATA